ncbi:cobyric acid synthase [Phaeovulum vinaykumarii]|nr:cobyric acid synthase [Phaeovulum vinaykumarii]
MVMGTGSDVGKSLIVAGLCRAFARRGLKVAPFKAQNMSNNAAVTQDGGEIGRAQALQARACGLAPLVDMNPVLLKPETDVDAQVVLSGKVLGRHSAAEYQALKPGLRPAVRAALNRLGTGRDLVLIEGAGSGGERYLRAQDISNMGLAESADLPVVLLGDESRGGVTAAVLGHHLLWSASERARVVGVLVNKFRGDPAIFAPAAQEIEAATGWPLLGLLRWSEAARALPEEDSLGLARAGRRTGARLRIVVPELPRIANFDDLDPLAAEPGLEVIFARRGAPLPRADVIVLAGSKATRADLATLRAEGWDIDILAHHRQGGRVLGICGGYQMLGQVIADPQGIEGAPGQDAGLGLLRVETVLTGEKRLERIAARDGLSGAALAGYEMHMGRTTGPDRARPFLRLDGRDAGAVSADGRVAGCYLHGLFASDAFRAAWLAPLGVGAQTAFETRIETALDRLADDIAADLDLDRLWALARPPRS